MNKFLIFLLCMVLQVGALYLGDYVYYLQYGHSIFQGDK